MMERAGARTAKARPAVFFDRDGVLNADKGYTYRREDFAWMPGAMEAVRHFNEQGYYVFVVTNQSGVARGYYREEDVQTLHRWMNEELAARGAHIDGFYYCPHHPDKGEAPYRQACQCRKPEPGLIRRAMEEWNVDKARSLLIGDKASDIQAAQAAGIAGHLFDGADLYGFVREIADEAEK